MDKIRKVKELLRHQEEIQKWHRKSGKEKNPHIQKTIAFGYAVLDFLYHGECRVHKAQINDYMFFCNCGSSAIKCIEDIHNYKVQSFIHKIRKVAFSDYNQWVAFTTHPSRRKIIVGECPIQLEIDITEQRLEALNLRKIEIQQEIERYEEDDTTDEENELSLIEEDIATTIRLIENLYNKQGN